MNKILKLTIIILAVLLLLAAVYFFFKGLTGRVVLDNNKNDTNEKFTSENESYDRDVNNFNVVNKSPEDLNEKECTILTDGRKLCLVKKGAKVNAGEVTDES